MSLCVLFVNVWFVNWINGWRLHVRRENCHWFPLIGGVLGALAVFVLPVPTLRGYWWLPFVIDWGCAPGLMLAAIWYLRRWYASTRRSR